MILSEPAPPPINFESYGVAPEHAFTPACLAVQEAFNKQEVMPLDRVQMFAGRLVLMEITIAQLRLKATRIPSRISFYMQQIANEEIAVTEQSSELNLSEQETSEAIDIAVAVFDTLRSKPTDTQMPLLQLENGATPIRELAPRNELAYA